MHHEIRHPENRPAAVAVPRVTVVIPAYNGAWCVEPTLASLKAQTLADFEAIIVDDGSKDGTAELVRRLTAGDPRFRVIEQPNAGAATARNRALALAAADLIAPLDQDDVWAPRFLQTLVDALAARPDAVMAFARSVWIDAAGQAPPQAPARFPARIGYRELLLRNPIGNGSAAVVRREALAAIGGFDPDLQRTVGQADDWWTQLQISWQGEVVFVDEALVRYRITPAAASQRAIGRMAAATREIIEMARARGPRLPVRDYRLARSLAMLWQMRRARQTGQRGLMLRLALDAYLSNPLWFLERELRAPLVSALTWPFRARRPEADVWRRLLEPGATSAK